ncbi:MAG: hypothetical protein AAB602_00575 [Patescibacteria group bacterium]
MMIRKSDELKRNQIRTSLLVFMESYNKNIPVDFPHPAVKILKIFQELHPMLFKRGAEWSIDKHRKKLMDWLPSYSTVL